MLSVFLKQFLSSCKHERDPDKTLLISPGLSRIYFISLFFVVVFENAFMQ